MSIDLFVVTSRINVLELSTFNIPAFLYALFDIDSFILIEISFIA